MMVLVRYGRRASGCSGLGERLGHAVCRGGDSPIANPLLFMTMGCDTLPTLEM